MKNQLTPANPHGVSRYGYAWQKISDQQTRASGSPEHKHLDIGCYDGKWLASLNGSGHTGVDLNQDAIEIGKKNFSHLDLRHIADVKALPFAPASFDSVSMLDVLEHMDLATQEAVIRQIYSVLKPGGTLIITVPGRHFFSFLDLGNLKFVFPRLHRFFYTLRHGAQEYHYRYVDNPFGLVGDVMATKRWHQHFSRQELESLVGTVAPFEMLDWDGTGFFTRVLVLFRPLLRTRLNGALKWDSKKFHSTNLYMSFKKTAPAASRKCA